LGHRLNQANPKWVTLLNEFIQTTENLTGMNSELQENDQFFIDNHEIIETLVQERNAFWRRLGNRLDTLRQSLVNNPEMLEGLRREPWVYQGSCLVFEFGKSSDDYIKLDLHINPDGWSLTLFGQTKAAHNALIRSSEESDILNNIKRRSSDDRYVLGEWSLATDQQLILEAIVDWVERTKGLVDQIAPSL
jgi:hypothetical protein